MSICNVIMQKSTLSTALAIPFFFNIYQGSNLTFFSTSKNLLVTIFSTSHSVPCFNTLKWETYENIVAKGEIAYNEQFLLFPKCFLHY